MLRYPRPTTHYCVGLRFRLAQRVGGARRLQVLLLRPSGKLDAAALRRSPASSSVQPWVVPQPLLAIPAPPWVASQLAAPGGPGRTASGPGGSTRSVGAPCPGRASPSTRCGRCPAPESPVPPPRCFAPTRGRPTSSARSGGPPPHRLRHLTASATSPPPPPHRLRHLTASATSPPPPPTGGPQ